jgi:ribosomal protein S18 acetylase RimI-like enzyme
VALLPWDADIFGFPVADYQIGDPAAIASAPRSFENSFAAWTSDQGVELVSCFVPADQPVLRALLAEIGFVCVDMVLRATLIANGPWSPAQVDFANAGDQADLERIAETAIQCGRYHADARFPRDLANRRYRMWVRNAFATAGAQTAIYVVRRSERAVVFSHVEFEDGKAHAALTAVEPGFQRSGIGNELVNMRLNDLARRGIRETYSRVSAGNSSILNFYAALGFRLSLPLAVYHWHAPQAPHLLSVDDVCASRRPEEPLEVPTQRFAAGHNGPTPSD